MSILLALWSWCLAHPLIVWPVFTFVVTAAFGEADKYAETHPRFARALALLNAAGLSAPGLLKALRGKLVPVALVLLAIVAPIPLAAVVSCSPSVKAKTADVLYSEQLHACVENASSRAEADACIKDINAKWDDAGAPAAARDGGDQ